MGTPLSAKAGGAVRMRRVTFLVMSKAFIVSRPPCDRKPAASQGRCRSATALLPTTFTKSLAQVQPYSAYHDHKINLLKFRSRPARRAVSLPSLSISLSPLGERVDCDGAFISLRGPGEGVAQSHVSASWGGSCEGNFQVHAFTAAVLRAAPPGPSSRRDT